MLAGSLIRPTQSPLDLSLRAWLSDRKLLCAYHGFGQPNIENTRIQDRFISTRIPIGMGFLGYDTPAGMQFSYINGISHHATKLGRRIAIVAIPLAFSDGTTLAQVAAGTHDARYQSGATGMAAYDFDLIYLRPGWEMNGNWYPWTAGSGKEADFIAAFQHVVTIYKNTSSKYRVIWNPTERVGSYVNSTYANPSDCYPGDAYVDVIGIDSYNEAQSGTAQSDPEYRWARERYGHNPVTPAVTSGYQPFGLLWLKEFAASRSKPMAIPEWGCLYKAGTPSLMTGDDTTYMTNILNYIETENVEMHGYFDVTSAVTGVDHRITTSDTQYPNAAAIFMNHYL